MPKPDAAANSDAPAPDQVTPTTERSPFRNRHSWPQRALLTVNCLVIIGCFVGATGLLLGRNVGRGIAKVPIVTPQSSIATDTVTATATTSAAEGDTISPVGTLGPDETTTVSSGPPETFPPADPNALNFLITGADNNACIDPNSPYAGAFGNRESMGERSDTIMIMRLDPSTHRGALLSFPRDLWVKIDGRGSSSRINSAYVKNDPQKLINTIYNNFGVTVDHFIQIDFCAFKTIVDGIDGGVGVPFDFPARDRNTGLNVPAKGCYYFTGDSALAYVRSRHYQYQNDNGKWKTDGVSDLGRISRQQDFIRRVLTAALNRGLFNPSVARSLIDASQNNVVVDTELTISRMLQFVGVLRDVQATGIASYQIEASGKNINGNAVLIANVKSANMKAILRIFKGEAPLAEAPVQVFDTTTTTSVAPSTENTTASSTGGTGSTTTTTTTTTTVPTTTVPIVTAPADAVPAPDENNKGIIPPRDVICP